MTNVTSPSADREDEGVPAHPERPRLRSFARGLRLGIPILLAYLPVGAAFGIVAQSTGFSPLQAVACSAIVLAGAGQFIAVQVLAGGGGVMAALVATTMVNLRYVLFSATMSPYLRKTPRPRQLLLGFLLTDETFGVNATDAREGRADDHSMTGVGVVAWTGWVTGTALGVLAAGAIGDPGRWGVGFAMPAMFTALLVAQLTDRGTVLAAGSAAGLTLALSQALPGKWPVVIGAVAAAALATAFTRAPAPSIPDPGEGSP